MNLINLLNDYKARGLDPIQSIKDELHLTVREVGPFALFDYNQIESPRKHPVADECRGVVIDMESMTVARRMFDRFYNYGEFPELEKEFDWNTAVVDEKVDGSIIGVWFNHRANRWEIGTRGNAFGDNTVTTLTGEDSTITFRSLFLRAMQLTEDEFQDLFDIHCQDEYTFIFELCTLENKVVTSYECDKVFLLGIRNNVTAFEADPTAINMCALDLKVLRPKHYDLGSFDDAVKAANELGGLKEGFVIRDGQNRRMKIKSVAYVAAHHLRGNGMTPRRAIDLVLAGEAEEFCAYFPEYKEVLYKFDQIVYDRLHDIEASYYKIRHLTDQKEYALEAVKFPWSGILFALKKNPSMSILEYVKKLGDNARENVFKGK